MLNLIQAAPAAPPQQLDTQTAALPHLPPRPWWTWMADPSHVVIVAGAPGQEAQPCVVLHKALHKAGMGSSGQDRSGRSQVLEQEALGRVRVGHLDIPVTAHGITYDRARPSNTGSTYMQDILCRRSGQAVTDGTAHRYPVPVWEAIDVLGVRHIDHAAHLAFRMAVTKRVYPAGIPARLVAEAVGEVVDHVFRLGRAGKDAADQLRLVPWTLLTEAQRGRLASVGITPTGQVIGAAAAAAAAAPAAAPASPDVALLQAQLEAQRAQMEALKAQMEAMKAAAERDSAVTMAAGLADEAAAREAADAERRAAKADAERRRRASKADTAAQQPPADQVGDSGGPL
jgi:hypothetical protein